MTLIKIAAASLPATGALVLILTAAAVTTAVKGFNLTTVGALSLYFIVWWTALFAVLPFGARSQAAAGDVVAGSEPGAPATPSLNEKAIWTTIVADLVFVAVVAVLPLSGL